MATFAIPTCDRPDLLSKSVASVTRAITPESGTRRIIVLDDSRSLASQDAARRIVEAAQKDAPVPVEYWGREERRRLVRRIVAADSTGIPERVITFALLGNDEAAGATGSGGSRNTALLLGAGGPVVSMDDDARFEFLTLRGTRVSPGKPVESIRDHDFGPIYVQGPVDTPRRFGALTDPVDMDVAGWIVSAFGNNRPGTDDNRCALRAVMTGIAGNRWYDRLEPPFHSRGAVRDVVYRSKRRYHRALRSGYALMQSNRYVATQVPFFVACCCGFDARTLLPPFPPDLIRSEDEVFLRFLKTMSRHNVIGHLPIMVRHDLAARRPDGFRAPGVAPLPITEVAKAIVADIVTTTFPHQGVEGLLETGKRMQERAGVSTADWLDYAHTVWVRSRSGKVITLEQLLNQYNESPAYWAEDVSQYIAALRLSVPNITNDSDREQILSLQRYMDTLGELLTWWPDIWNVAAELQRVGGLEGDRDE